VAVDEAGTEMHQDKRAELLGMESSFPVAAADLGTRLMAVELVNVGHVATAAIVKERTDAGAKARAYAVCPCWMAKRIVSSSQALGL